MVTRIYVPSYCSTTKLSIPIGGVIRAAMFNELVKRLIYVSIDICWTTYEYRNTHLDTNAERYSDVLSEISTIELNFINNRGKSILYSI